MALEGNPRHLAAKKLGDQQVLCDDQAMKSGIELSEDLDRRLDLLAACTRRTCSEIIEDALSHGRSLAWQERWIDGVKAGLADAEAGKFAREAEISAVLARYGSE